MLTYIPLDLTPWMHFVEVGLPSRDSFFFALKGGLCITSQLSASSGLCISMKLSASSGLCIARADWIFGLVNFPNNLLIVSMI